MRYERKKEMRIRKNAYEEMRKRKNAYTTKYDTKICVRKYAIKSISSHSEAVERPHLTATRQSLAFVLTGHLRYGRDMVNGLSYCYAIW